MNNLVYVVNDVLHWKRRTENMNLPPPYNRTCNLFNSRYADQPITTATFKCCGIEYKTEEVLKCKQR